MLQPRIAGGCCLINRPFEAALRLAHSAIFSSCLTPDKAANSANISLMMASSFGSSSFFIANFERSIFADHLHAPEFREGDVVLEGFQGLLVVLDEHLHHLELFLGAAVGVGVVVGVLLEEADLDHARDVEDELLLVGRASGPRRRTSRS